MYAWPLLRAEYGSKRKNECFPVPVPAWEFGLARQVRPSRLASACSFSTRRLNLVTTTRLAHADAKNSGATPQMLVAVQWWGTRVAWGGGRKKSGWGVSWTTSKNFGINADQWTAAAQDEGEWPNTAEQRAEHFMAKRIYAEKARAVLRHSVVCLNVTGRTKERVAQSKRARAGSLAMVD